MVRNGFCGGETGIPLIKCGYFWTSQVDRRFRSSPWGTSVKEENMCCNNIIDQCSIISWFLGGGEEWEREEPPRG